MICRVVLFVLPAFLLISTSLSLEGAQWYIDAAVSGSGNGQSPDTAFKTIQEGIDAASPGDRVIVAEGNYAERILFSGKNIILTSTDPADSSVVANTIINGSQAGSVVTFAGTEEETCVLSGFTLRNGKAFYGAGILGGTYDQHSRATIEYNVITANQPLVATTAAGSGIAFCDGVIRNNNIRGNSAGGAHSRGGGLFACNGIVENNRIADNIGAEGGGLSYCHGVIQNNVISGNTGRAGGGLGWCHGIIQNNLIVGNQASGGDPNLGGGLSGCQGIIRNNTIAENSALGTGGGVFACHGTIENCIVWGNSAPTGPQLYGSALPDDSCIQDWSGGGEGNIANNPSFVDASSGDYRLQDSSSCIDAGRNDDWAWQTTALDAASRVLHGRFSLRVDMGAYEYGLPPPGRTWYVDASVTESGDGTSWQTAKKTIQEGIEVAGNSDTVLVAEGIYHENIDFKGKNIAVRSTGASGNAAISTTIVDGSQAGPVVTFAGTENQECLLSGFTIRNGGAVNGGGIFGGTGKVKTRARIENNIITGNTASASGGGLYGCQGPILNNTVCGNSAGQGGGGLSECNGTIRNCIVWGNAGGGQLDAGTRAPAYSCIEGWVDGGEGNRFFAPYFVAASNGDYRLQSWSPCIDAGDPAASFFKEPPPTGGRINMGAYGNTPEAASRSSDGDSDGLPDDWEIVFFGHIAFGGMDDLDGDLSSNLDEYRRGSDPATAQARRVPAKWHVDRSLADSGDGASWETAFRTIQEGVDAANDGDTVTVAEGVYDENVIFKGKNIILTSTDPLDPTVVQNTVIDGMQSGPCVRFQGTEHGGCVLRGFTIQNGDAANGGGICGGTFVDHTDATIESNVITGNSADFGGGIAYCAGIVQGCRILVNTGQYCGGGLSWCDATIRHNLILANAASGQVAFGGGLFFCGGPIRSNVIAGNAASASMSAGGGLALCGGTVCGNTIVANSTDWGGGLAFCFGTASDSIIWANTARISPAYHGFLDVTYSCVQGGDPGRGNIGDDPEFADPDGPDNRSNTYDDNDYRVAPGSPCIDKGRNETWMRNAVDLEGNPRIWRGESSWTVDMGAYEYDSFLLAVMEIGKATGGGAELTWSSRSGDTYIVWSSSDLSVKNPWTTVEATIPSEGETTSWIDPDTAPAPKFYRIGVE